MAETILRLKNVSKHYIVELGGLKKKIIKAANGVSFKIKAEESLGLIGESGSGKSTIANIVLKLIDPSEGEVNLFSENVTDYSESAMRKFRKDMQIIFQYTGAVLDPKMTIDELLREPLKIHNIVKGREIDNEVDRLLNMVGISPKEKYKFPDQLSGGQQQRVIIARAISTRPKLIICDEPVSALDVSVQGQILNLLADLKKELKLTYLFISHDLKVIQHICEKIAVMNLGEIVEMGNTDDILNNPKDEYTKKMIAAKL